MTITYESGSNDSWRSRTGEHTISVFYCTPLSVFYCTRLTLCVVSCYFLAHLVMSRCFRNVLGIFISPPLSFKCNNVCRRRRRVRPLRIGERRPNAAGFGLFASATLGFHSCVVSNAFKVAFRTPSSFLFALFLLLTNRISSQKR